MVTEGSCSRCFTQVRLDRVGASELFAWHARARTKEHPNPLECWAVDGDHRYGRMHHVDGQPQMLKEVINND